MSEVVAAAPQRVLVVDDDVMIRMVAREVLEEAGFAVDEAAGAPEAMALLERRRPDIILLDVLISGTDGFTICRDVRASRQWAGIPVVMITGLDDDDSISRAYREGATDFVTKPIQWPVLVHRIRHLIGAARTERELEKSRINYQALFENNPHPMWVYDLETLAFLEVNEAAIRHYGYSRQEFLAMTIADIRPAEDVVRLSRIVTGLTEGINYSGIWRHRKKDGAIIEVEITSHSEVFAGKKARVALANDVTERLESERELHRSQQQYQKLFDGVHDVLYVIAPDGTFVSLNAAFEAVSGWPRSEWIGRNFIELIHPDDREQAVKLFGAGLAGESEARFELRTLGRSGVVTVEASLMPQLDGGEVRALQGIARDLTARKKVEEELKRADRALRTVSACNKALVYASDEVSLLNEICRSIVAHRGYLFAWVGYALEDEAKSVGLMARAGEDGGYLDEVEVTWGDSDTGRGPAGVAIRTGEPRAIRDIGGDADFTPWLQAARKAGYRSVVALPLISEVKPFGALIIYSCEVGAFDEVEVQLLKELASNLSYGICALRVRQEHRRAECALKKSQRRLKEALHLAKLGHWSWKDRDRFSWSPEVSRIFDLPAELPPPSFEEQRRFFSPQSWQAIETAMGGTLQTGEKFQLELEMTSAAGRRTWLVVRGAAVKEKDGTVTGVYGTAQDVTEMKEAQLAGARLQRRLAAMWNIGRMVDADYQSLNESVLLETVAITDSRYGFFGYLDEDQEMLTISAWSHGVMDSCRVEDRPLVFKVSDGGLWTEAARTGKVVIVNDYHTPHAWKKGVPGGHVELTRLMAVPIFSNDRLVALSVVANKETDYTAEDADQVEAFLRNVQILLDKRRAEESVALLSRAVEQSPVSIVITDTQGNIEFVNPKFTQLTGYPLAEVLGENPRFLKSGEVPPERYREMWQTISSGRTWQGEFLNKKKNGEVFLEVAAISPVKNREGEITHYVAVKEDVTEHRKLEEQLRHAQKMEAIGTLAGGIAHDFNNILTTVISYCTLMERKLPEGDPLRGYVAKVLGAADRAASLTHGLLTYSRKQPTQTRPINLNDLLAQVEHLLSKLLTEDIELRIRPHGQPLIVMADPVQLEQVLMNLASNARDAMMHGGSIDITAQSRVLERQLQIPSGCVSPGSYAVVTVADSGTGMDAETLERIFEPFYTTKEVGRGSGLGLSITYGIVTHHGGFIDVQSRLGEGTTFTIFLPLTAEAKTVVLQPAQPEPGIGKETVLLVEDDLLIREIFKEVLQEGGYRVITAADGEEGVARFREHQGEIELLVLDVIMPKKTGVAVYEEIRKDFPEIKALFISGYAADTLSERALLVDQNVLVVQKPLTPNVLLSKVREVLDAKGEEMDQPAAAVR